MASTCGMNCLSFWITRATPAREGAAGGAAGPPGTSHTTTPEQSCRLLTAGTGDSERLTRPDTVAPAAGHSRIRLKKIRKSQVIVVRKQRLGADVAGSDLGRFKTREHVRSQAEEDIGSVRQILPDAALWQVRVAIVLLA